jgi:hypothetical protein
MIDNSKQQLTQQEWEVWEAMEKNSKVKDEERQKSNWEIILNHIYDLGFKDGIRDKK